MWFRLRLCLSLNRRQSGEHRLLKSGTPSEARRCKSIDFQQISKTWSKFPLTSISECDEDAERSVWSSTESDSSEHHQVEHEKTIPDFTSVCTSSRFFFSAPGSSSSIIEIESTPLSQTSSALLLQPPVIKLTRNSVAVETYSASPYIDFKTSMQEMVDASRVMKKDSSAKWSFLHEMLLCYLALNHKSTHKLIVHAFGDVLLNLVVVDVSYSRGVPNEPI